MLYYFVYLFYVFHPVGFSVDPDDGGAGGSASDRDR